MNAICPFRLLVYQIISSRLELTALTITWYTVPCLLIRASSDLFNVLFYFLPQPALSEVSNSLRQPEFILRAVYFLTGNAVFSALSCCICFSPSKLLLIKWKPMVVGVEQGPFQPKLFYDSTISTLSDEACNSAVNAARSFLAPKPTLRKKVIYFYPIWPNGTLNQEQTSSSTALTM